MPGVHICWVTAQRELDDESKAKAAHQSSLSSKPSEKQFESAPVLECILLVCPFCSESFPRQEIDNHMLLCLREVCSAFQMFAQKEFHRMKYYLLYLIIIVMNEKGQ